MKDYYIVYEYLGNDERIERNKGYTFYTVYNEKGEITSHDILDMKYEIRKELVERYNISEPEDINVLIDILVTYIKEIA